MHLLTLTITTAFLGLTTAFQCPSTTVHHASERTTRHALTDFANLFYTKKSLADAFDKYVAVDYIQHNAGILDGRAAAVATLKDLWSNPNNTFEIAEIMIGAGLRGDSLAAIHIKATVGANMTVVDLYRLKGTCIVEHWDVLQAMEGTTVSKHPYF